MSVFKIITLLLFLAINITAQDFRPTKSKLSWGKDEKGLQMAVWTNPEATKIFAVIRNFSNKKICYCDYVLGNFVKVYARKNFNYEWQEMKLRPPTEEEKEIGVVGVLPCSENNILKPKKEMPPFRSEYEKRTISEAEKNAFNYSFNVDLDKYIFPENLSGIVEVKIVQRIFNGRCDDAFNGDVESEPFNTQVPIGKPTPNNLSAEQKMLIKEKALEIKKIYNSASYFCSFDSWNHKRFYYDYPDKQLVDYEIASLLSRYEKSGFAKANIAMPLQLKTDVVEQLFPNHRFYFICWSEMPIEGKKFLGLGAGIYYTLAIDSEGNKTKLQGSGNFEEFGEFLSTNKIKIKNSEDARLVWLAFCDIHRKPWHSTNFKQISPTEWHLGLSQTDEPFRTEQFRQWYQFMLDDNQQVISAKLISETVK